MNFGTLPIYGEGRPVYEKPSYFAEEEARILITVKASPQPSQKYGDTVCVAGVRMRDTGPEWIRLYPVPFRSLDSLARFKKYNLIRVPVVPASDDPRAESFKPRTERIALEEFLPPWKARHPYIGPLADNWTMCGIQNARKRGDSYPSLAIIRPRVIRDLRVTKHKGWSPAQLAKLRKDIDQLVLFGEQPKPNNLQAPRFQGKYRYLCQISSCRGHEQSMIDWEFDEFVRRHTHGMPDCEAIELVRSRFFDEMCAPKRAPLFFVGNQAARPQAYSVLGIYRSASYT